MNAVPLQDSLRGLWAVRSDSATLAYRTRSLPKAAATGADIAAMIASVGSAADTVLAFDEYRALGPHFDTVVASQDAAGSLATRAADMQYAASGLCAVLSDDLPGAIDALIAALGALDSSAVVSPLLHRTRADLITMLRSRDSQTGGAHTTQIDSLEQAFSDQSAEIVRQSDAAQAVLSRVEGDVARIVASLGDADAALGAATGAARQLEDLRARLLSTHIAARKTVGVLKPVVWSAKQSPEGDSNAKKRMWRLFLSLKNALINMIDFETALPNTAADMGSLGALADDVGAAQRAMDTLRQEVIAAVALAGTVAAELKGPAEAWDTALEAAADPDFQDLQKELTAEVG